jgi:hypothetical protein
MGGTREQEQAVGGMGSRALPRALRALPRTLLLFVAHVAGWLIAPLYVAGICTTFLLGRSAGLPNEHPMEDAAQFVGFGAFAVVGALLVAKRPSNLQAYLGSGRHSTITVLCSLFSDQRVCR